MPPRVRRNGAVRKPSSSRNSQRTARSVTSRIVDSTAESTDETSRKSPGEEGEGEGSEGGVFEEEGSIKEGSLEEEEIDNGALAYGDGFRERVERRLLVDDKQPITRKAGR